MIRGLFLVLMLLAMPTGSATGASPYAGQEGREIKALSSDDVNGYLNGAGMGFAKAAELNRYPGPKHVMELADQLDLSAEQRARTEQIFATMKAQATALGEQLIATEQALDESFAKGEASAELLEALVGRSGQLQAQIRFVHLNAHLAQRAIMSDAQVKRYVHLRGYHQGGHHGQHHH